MPVEKGSARYNADLLGCERCVGIQLIRGAPCARYFAFGMRPIQPTIKWLPGYDLRLLARSRSGTTQVRFLSRRPGWRSLSANTTGLHLHVGEGQVWCRSTGSSRPRMRGAVALWPGWPA